MTKNSQTPDLTITHLRSLLTLVFLRIMLPYFTVSSICRYLCTNGQCNAVFHPLRRAYSHQLSDLNQSAHPSQSPVVKNPNKDNPRLSNNQLERSKLSRAACHRYFLNHVFRCLEYIRSHFQIPVFFSRLASAADQSHF